MKACYPGSFDPVTNGHMDMIRRSASKFDELVVLIMANPNKKSMFSAEERKQMIETAVKEAGLANVTVMIGSGLTVRYAKSVGCEVLVRGVRSVTDYEYELAQASANMMLEPEIETIFLIAKAEYAYISSSVVKEIAANGGDVSSLVPVMVNERIIEETAKA